MKLNKRNTLSFFLILSLFVVWTACEPVEEKQEAAEEVASKTAPAEDKNARPSPPSSAQTTIGASLVQIDFSMPSVKGRKIWGGLVPYGKVWRTGANEATTIEFSKDMLLQGEAIKAGKYALFTIPNKEKWTLILNRVADQWGAFEYDASEDVLKVEIEPTTSKELAERLHFAISKNGEASLLWEYIQLKFQLQEAKEI